MYMLNLVVLTTGAKPMNLHVAVVCSNHWSVFCLQICHHLPWTAPLILDFFAEVAGFLVIPYNLHIYLKRHLTGFPKLFGLQIVFDRLEDEMIHFFFLSG